MANTNLAYNYITRIGGSGQRHYYDAATGTGARTNAEKDFSIHTFTVNHSQYLEADKIQRITVAAKWIIPTERLIPAKMTTFGGMYSVRGYKESRIVADGGIIASLQFEHDLVKEDQAKGITSAGATERPWLRKLAPLAFFDYGLSNIKDQTSTDKDKQELYSVGVGALVEVGDHFSGAAYYGFPLRSTDTTDNGEGRFNVSVMMRW
jgi:hemolysin activation/secretion protein